MTKKKNTEEIKSVLQQKLEAFEKQGLTYGVILGLNGDEFLMLDHNFASFEQIHAILNRAINRLTIAHEQFIINQSESKETKAE